MSPRDGGVLSDPASSEIRGILRRLAAAADAGRLDSLVLAGEIEGRTFALSFGDERSAAYAIAHLVLRLGYPAGGGLP